MSAKLFAFFVAESMVPFSELGITSNSDSVDEVRFRRIRIRSRVPLMKKKSSMVLLFEFYMGR
jgi:hypothetical protein